MKRDKKKDGNRKKKQEQNSENDAETVRITIEDEEPEEKKKMEVLFKGKKPNSSFKKLLLQILPCFCVHFLYSETEEFRYTKILMGIGCGGFIGVGIFMLLIYPMALYEGQKIDLLYGVAGCFAAGFASSSNFRCSTLMIAPNIIGKEGRAYLVIYVVGSIYAGPVANLQHNMEEILQTLGCSVELQVNHTKAIWKIVTAPIKKILENLLQSSKELKNETKDAFKAFKEVRDEVESSIGLNKETLERKQKEAVKEEMTMAELERKQEEEEEKARQQESMKTGKVEVFKKTFSSKKNKSSTQKTFELKTRLRCEYVVEQGIDRCKDWFDKTHEKCMRTIFLPVLNNLLCLPLQFKFFCYIMNLATKWCKDKIPMDKNFGKNFDNINKTFSEMGNDFNTEMVLTKEEHSMLIGVNLTQMLITDEIKETLSKRQTLMLKVMTFVRAIMSCTFVFLFISAFNYTNKYNRDIRHDNKYITTYFKQIDARRKKQNKRYLLPLRKGEYKNFIFPFKLKIQGPEMKMMMMQLAQCFPLVAFLGLSFLLDLILYHLFMIIRKHAEVNYVFSSQHKLEISVGGAGFLARLLRKTVSALNTSSNVYLSSSNQVCLPSPIRMNTEDYLYSCLPLAILVLLSVVQVHVNRLNRAIAAFFFPKREKTRVLFLYNEHLRNREAYADIKRKEIMRKARFSRLLTHNFMTIMYRHCKILRRFIRRRCLVCDELEMNDSHICQTPDCGVIYCRQCWRDMNRFCFACMPYEDYIEADSESGNSSGDAQEY